jgi:hypothetical protein
MSQLLIVGGLAILGAVILMVTFRQKVLVLGDVAPDLSPWRNELIENHTRDLARATKVYRWIGVSIVAILAVVVGAGLMDALSSGFGLKSAGALVVSGSLLALSNIVFRRVDVYEGNLRAILLSDKQEASAQAREAAAGAEAVARVRRGATAPGVRRSTAKRCVVTGADDEEPPPTTG